MSEIVQKLIKQRVQNKVNEIDKIASTNEGRELLSKVAESRKEADGGIGKLLNNFTGGLAAGASLGAGGAAAAYEYGQQSEPGQEHLDKILEKNPEIKRQYNPSEIQTTFDSLKVHIPRMLKQDPYGSGQVMKKMLSKEGYDVRSLDKILDIEKKKQDMEGEVFNKLSSADDDNQASSDDGANSFFQKVATRAREINNNQTENENYQEDFNELKNLFNDE